MNPRGRHRPSSIDKLDPEIRELIGQLRIDKGWTIDEIRAQLSKLLTEEHLPSRTALGRHVKSIEEIGAQLRQSREVAHALVQQLGDAPENKTAALNIELAHAMMLRFMTTSGEDGLPVTLGPEEQMFVARSLQSLAGAQKTNADMTLKVREAAVKDAAAKAGAAAKTKGLGKETVDFITNAVLGVEA